MKGEDIWFYNNTVQGKVIRTLQTVALITLWALWVPSCTERTVVPEECLDSGQLFVSTNEGEYCE